MSINIFAGKSATEAKELYHSIALEQHPDKGGNLQLMQAVNSMYDEFNGKECNSSLSVIGSHDLDKGELINRILEATGLNWTVRKEAITTVSGIPITDKMAIIKENNNIPLAVMGGGYEILQNEDLAKLVYESGEEVFSENAIFKHPWNNCRTLGSLGNISGGSLREGCKVFFQLELPDVNIGKGGVKRYITVTNSHDGTSSVGFGTSSQVICCSNTFNIANKMLSKFRHTASLQEKLDESMKLLRQILRFEDEQIGDFDKMAIAPLSAKLIENVRKSVFENVDFSDKKMSTRQTNLISAYDNSVKRSFNEQGETAWGLFNGVTRYTNHCLNMQDITFNLMFGTAAKINQRAFDVIKAAI